MTRYDPKTGKFSENVKPTELLCPESNFTRRCLGQDCGKWSSIQSGREVI